MSNVHLNQLPTLRDFGATVTALEKWSTCCIKVSNASQSHCYYFSNIWFRNHATTNIQLPWNAASVSRMEEKFRSAREQTCNCSTPLKRIEMYSAQAAFAVISNTESRCLNEQANCTNRYFSIVPQTPKLQPFGLSHFFNMHCKFQGFS